MTKACIRKSAAFLACMLAAPAAQAMRGDFDGDGRWTARDAEAALQMSAGLRAVDLNLDVDSDRQVMSSDARIILQGSISGQMAVASSASATPAASASSASPSPPIANTPVATAPAPAPVEHPKSTAALMDPPPAAKAPEAKNSAAVPTFTPAIGPPPATPAVAAAAAPPPPEGSLDDFADPTLKSASSTPAAGSARPPSQPNPGVAPSQAELNAFARGQAKFEAARNAAPVKGDYAEAGRLEKALQAAEAEYRRAAAEARRIAQAKAEATARAEAQRCAAAAYQNWLAQVQAYNDWVARQNAVRQSSAPVMRPVQPGQHPQGGAHSTGIIRDAPQ